MTDAHQRLIVALDFASAKKAEAFISAIGAPAIVYKIGLELIYADGLDLARSLTRDGHRIFIDAKLHDIGNTVERAVAAVADLGAEFLTIHAADAKTMAGAVAGREGSRLKLLGVTVLTNLTEADVPGLRESGGLDAAVLTRATLARAVGLDGVVASPLEASRLRAEFGAEFLIVTPGIRPSGSPAGDQARTATPSDALKAGASHLVIGRPVTQAADPKAALDAVLDEMSEFLAAR